MESVRESAQRGELRQAAATSGLRLTCHFLAFLGQRSYLRILQVGPEP